MTDKQDQLQLNADIYNHLATLAEKLEAMERQIEAEDKGNQHMLSGVMFEQRCQQERVNTLSANLKKIFDFFAEKLAKQELVIDKQQQQIEKLQNGLVRQGLRLDQAEDFRDNLKAAIED